MQQEKHGIGVKVGIKSFTSKDLAVITLNNFMHNWGHKFIYSNEMTEHILKIAGFRNVKKGATLVKATTPNYET